MDEVVIEAELKTFFSSLKWKLFSEQTECIFLKGAPDNSYWNPGSVVIFCLSLFKPITLSFSYSGSQPLSLRISKTCFKCL